MRVKSFVKIFLISAILLSLYAISYLLVVPVQAKEIATDKGMVSDNKDSNYYTWYWYHPIKSNLFVEGDKLVRVEGIGKNVIIEYYDMSFNLISRKQIAMENDAIFGGAFIADGEHYILFGYSNEKEDDNKTVYRLVKYGSQWDEIGSCSLKGANTVYPFDAGTARFAKSGHNLFIRTCHEMYKSEDGFNHQANVTIHIDTNHMTIVNEHHTVFNISTGYVSHSFNQFVQVDGDNLVSLDHGDAYPRSLVICRYKEGISSGDPLKGNVDHVNLLKFPGDAGDNYTGATVGSFEVSDKNYIATGVYNGNVFIATVPKDSFTDSSVSLKYITSYSGDKSLGSTVPFLTKVADNQYLLVWRHSKHMVGYVTVDQDGNIQGKIKRTTGSLSECPPVFASGRAVWYYTENSAPIFCYPLERPVFSGEINGTIDYGKKVSEAHVTFPVIRDMDGNIVAGSWSFDDPNYVVTSKTTKTVYATFRSQDSARYDDIKYVKIKLTVNFKKAAQPMVVKVKTKTVKAGKLKKKAVTVAPIIVSKAKGKVTYKVVGGNKKSKKALKLNTKTGKIKVRKKTKKGKYTIKIQVKAAGNDQYKAGSKTVNVTIKVK